MGKEMIEWIVALAIGIIIAIILTVFIGTFILFQENRCILLLKIKIK